MKVMGGEDYTTLKEMAAACCVGKCGIKKRKDVKGFTFHWAKGTSGKEKRFPLDTLPPKYKRAVSRYRSKEQVRSAIAPEIIDAQRTWMIRKLGKILRPIILEALFGAEE